MGRDAKVIVAGFTDFERAVAAVVRAIPRGEVLSYSRVALFAGRPGAARGVVKALNRFPGLPWWRVVRADNTLAKEVAAEQTIRLRREGVSFEGRRVMERSASPRRRRSGR